MTTWIPSSLLLGKSVSTSPCRSDIADGHDQDRSSVLGSPIHLLMNGTLLAVHFTAPDFFF